MLVARATVGKLRRAGYEPRMADATPPKVSPTRIESRAFALLLAASAFFFAWTVSPIWIPLLLGLLIAVLAVPLSRRLEVRLGRYPRLLAAALTGAALLLGLA